MYPVRTEDANLLYKGPTEDIGDLWVHRIQPGVVRVTYEPSPSELLLLEQGGRVQLTIMHEPIAPIMMEVKDEEVTRPIGDHPFKISKDSSISPTHSTPASVTSIEEARRHGQSKSEPTTPEPETPATRQVPTLGPTPEAFPPRAPDDDVPTSGERSGGSGGNPTNGSR